MSFRSLIFFFNLFCRFDSCLHIVAIIGIALVLGSSLRMPHRAVMTLVVQFTAVARLGHLVVLHRFVHLIPRLTESVAQGMGTDHISGECQTRHQDTVPVDGKA